MFHCDDWQFNYTIKMLPPDVEKQIYDCCDGIEGNELLILYDNGFTRPVDNFFYPRSSSHQYNPKVFFLLAPFLTNGNYMRVYNEKDGEIVCWLVYQESAQVFVTHWEFDCSLEEAIRKEENKKE